MRLVTPQPNGEFTAEEYAKLLFEQPMEDWEELLRINLSAVYFSCVAFMPLLAANPHKERASIVTIGSISGTTALSQTGQYAYNVCTSLYPPVSRTRGSEDVLELTPRTIIGLKGWHSLIDSNARE